MTEQLTFYEKPPIGADGDGPMLADFLRHSERREVSAKEASGRLGWGGGEQGKRRVRNAAESSPCCISGPGRPYVHASRLTRDEFEAICGGYMSQIQKMSDRLGAMRRAYYGGLWHKEEQS